MKILSIYPGHNASICILDNGEVLINWELERFSRIKHDYGFRQDFLLESLRLCDLTINDIDFICINKGLIDPCIVRKGTVKRPFDVPDTSNNAVIPFLTWFGGKKFEALAINHHFAHAASAFYTSPFEEAAIFTLDGYGDAENASFGFGQGNKIKDFNRENLSDIALWWASIPYNNYGMKRMHERDPGSHAGKLMALAAYGEPDAEVLLTLEQDMKKHFLSEKYPDPGSYAFNEAEDLSDTQSTRSKNLAYALQKKTESILTHYFNFVSDKYPNASNLSFAGGLALNCVANSVAMANSRITNVFIPPCPNDSGIALGMALYAYFHHFNNYRIPKHFNPYTGPSYPDAKDKFLLLATERGFGIEKEKSKKRLVEILCKREIVCIYGNRSECGPRALGNRSIICLPDVENCRDFLNFEVKKREWFRPYGPIILAEAASEVLENPPENSAYMNMCSVIKDEWRIKLSGVNHVDNRTRPQILQYIHNPFLHEVLTEIYKITGIPVLLNTSFNLHEPIVETPEDALKTFSDTPINYLVTEDLVITKLSVI